MHRLGANRLVVAAAGLAASLLAGCQRAPAPAPAPTNQGGLQGPRIEAAAEGMFADAQAPGMVVAIVRGEAATVRGFGRLSASDPRPPDGKTLVRLESVSKLFAAELLSGLVADGKLRLSDPLALDAPNGWRAPATKTAPITLLNLATHTAGLPRMAPIDPTLAPDAAIAARWAWLAKQSRLPPPGVRAVYSNVAFDLLGDALASADKASYDQALAATVTGPLGMADTTPRPTPEQCARFLAPDPRRPPHPCVDQTAAAASGGLYSTADDMALWMRAQLATGAPSPSRRISQAVYVRRDALAGATGLDHAGPASGVGLAWIEQSATASHPRVLEKTGGGDGFLSYVVLDPARRVGVFLAFDNMSGHRLLIVAQDANGLVGMLGAPSAAP